MKKIVSLLLTAALALGLSGCALTNNPGSGEASGSPSPAPTAAASTEPQPTATPEATAEPSQEPASSSETSKADPVVASQADGGDESGELPGIDGPEDFVNKFNGNPIDEYYLSEIKNAAAVSDMVEVTNKAAQAWETQLNTTFDKLAAAVNTDADENERVNNEQKAWANDINAMIEEIKAAAGEGSLANVEISHGVMLMYRGRCIQLLSELYNKTGDFTIKMSSSEAVG